MALTADELAEKFHPRPRTCTMGEDWNLARKDAAVAIELLTKEHVDTWNAAIEAAALKVGSGWRDSNEIRKLKK